MAVPLPVFLAQLQAAIARLNDTSAEILDAGAEDLVKTARAAAPVVTGRLRASIKTAKAQARGSDAIVTISAAAPYAAYVEYGTARHGPQPFMRPAANKAATRLESELADMLQDAGAGKTL